MGLKFVRVNQKPLITEPDTVYFIRKPNGMCQVYVTGSNAEVSAESPDELYLSDIVNEAETRTIQKVSGNSGHGLLSTPAGIIVPVLGMYAPPGTIKANGATLNRSEFSRLWSHAQNSNNLAASEASKMRGQYGPGNGSTTFSIPDLRGVSLRCLDDGAGLDPGRILGSYQQDAFQGHFHSYNSENGGGTGAAKLDRRGGNYSRPLVTEPISDGINGEPRIANETRGKNIAAIFCIVY